MAWYHKFPWTNFHELNLDWLIDVAGRAEKALPDIDNAINGANTAANNANSAASLANNNAVAASDAATRANQAAQNINPITATATTVFGAGASVTVEQTNPGTAFHFLIPAGERGEPGPSGSGGDYIINGNFSHPINQRGSSVYIGTGAKQYTIDRWYTESSASPAVTVSDGYITIAPGATLKQIIPADSIGIFISDADVGYTAVARETNGTLHVASATVTDSKLSFVIGDAGSGITVTLGAGSWEYCALYKGSYTADTVPGYQSAPYAIALAQCKRFYKAFGTTTLNGWVNGSGNSVVMGFDNSDMRIDSPTVICTVDSAKCNGNNITSANFSAPTSTAMETKLTLSSGSAYGLHPISVRFTSLAYDAEI